MITNTRMTAEEFAHRRHELPEAGRWHELHEGRAVLMDAPDDSHGNTVLNLSRALAEWFRDRSDRKVGYACHLIGLHVASNPDTVHFPAICYFDSGDQFGQTDKTIADIVPQLVVDVACGNDRRREMRRRILSYMQIGVQMVWVPDPEKKEIQVIARNAETLALGAWQTLEGAAVLPAFAITVKDVFAQPKWWQ